MSFKYVVAIIWPEFAVPLEAKLHSLGIGGITLSKVKGFGEYRNFFSGDGLTEHTKVEIFVEDNKVEALLAALEELASTGAPGSGIAAVVPVDKFLHLRTGTEVLPNPPTPPQS